MELHHISLLTADFEQNFDFYVNILGLRLVKNSINQGNIYMRHVYYGDFMGTPGTVVTICPVSNSKFLRILLNTGRNVLRSSA
ncbi:MULTISPECIES: VOC family protein [Lactococcus]|nr:MULTISPECIES: VOC family protein [Lactococcus]USI69423.1 VOC family protein [Lactococcus garvieae subsp. garvieae]MCG3096317.1 VOC family protein [Lactococcus petauri]MCR8687783.1 VOC family protein [Lactococcus petauri]MDC0808758.1 VOC family protein [Lactococcus petauri]MDC0810901.1 VOC family protein [Lactococcus petauri]